MRDQIVVEHAAKALPRDADRRQHRAENFDTCFTGLGHGVLQNLGADTANLQIQLNPGNSDLGSGDFEVHVAEVIFAAEDVGK